MVHSHPAVLVLIVFKQREVGHPQEVEGTLLVEVQHLGQVVAQSAQAIQYHLVLVGHDEQHIAVLGVHPLVDGLYLVLGEELFKGGGNTVSGEAGEGPGPWRGRS